MLLDLLQDFPWGEWLGQNRRYPGGDHLLRFDVDRAGADVDLHLLVDEGNDPVQARAAHALQAAEAEDHPALVFAVEPQAQQAHEHEGEKEKTEQQKQTDDLRMDEAEFDRMMRKALGTPVPAPKKKKAVAKPKKATSS